MQQTDKRHYKRRYYYLTAHSEQEKQQLETEMSSGTLDGNALVQKSMRVAELIELIDDKSMRWLELSEIG